MLTFDQVQIIRIKSGLSVHRFTLYIGIDFRGNKTIFQNSTELCGTRLNDAVVWKFKKEAEEYLTPKEIEKYLRRQDLYLKLKAGNHLSLEVQAQFNGKAAHIAKELDLSPNTVKNLLAKAKRKEALRSLNGKPATLPKSAGSLDTGLIKDSIAETKTIAKLYREFDGNHTAVAKAMNQPRWRISRKLHNLNLPPKTKLEK